ncbi:sensor histidine kinase [Brevibacillus choshinensis]|uniref:histidine kinase n=1 Tax=Brevibacillus choshinensis TaxID=54911 RepID=A0ABX7FLZ6_BRECH|nr:HAMP domain-containing sensor histidine kinase [Brevibacillus choshinensis]QRG66758.1 HAMP domain-containing histidine kinase [Brevibacillus choshinensis]
MSIKTRLLLSYIAMIIVPVVLFGLTASTLASVFFGEQARFGNEGGRSPIWNMFNERSEVFAGVKFMAQHDPDRLLDQSLLTSVDRQLVPLKSALVLVKDGRVAFASESIQKTEVERLLQGSLGSEKKRWIGQDGYAIESVDLTFSDSSAGTAYFLFDPKPWFATGRYFVLSMVLSLLVIIGLTNGVLTYLVSRSIIKPLHALKRVAEDIKEGNLERSFRLNRKDELGELGDAFEEMRGRLHDSIHRQLQYEESRKELIASISHDLKTPITGIQACVQAMRDGIADTEAKREKYVKMIGIKSEQMDRLIDELFLYSRLDEKKLPFHWEELDVAAFLKEFVEELRLDPRMEYIRVSCSSEGHMPSLLVMADREKLARVFMNVIDNSLKHLDKPEKNIRTWLSFDSEMVTISIEDNGSGIDPQALPYIFDRFYRVDPSRNAATGGSGLGLAIVKQIVEGHGGTVAATSQLGVGTVLQIALPRLSSKEGNEHEAHPDH